MDFREDFENLPEDPEAALLIYARRQKGIAEKKIEVGSKGSPEIWHTYVVKVQVFHDALELSNSLLNLGRIPLPGEGSFSHYRDNFRSTMTYLETRIAVRLARKSIVDRENFVAISQSYKERIHNLLQHVRNIVETRKQILTKERQY